MRSMILVAMLTACSGGTPAAPTEAHDEGGHGHAHDEGGHGHEHGDEAGEEGEVAEAVKPAGKVMFVEPADGATVKSPVHLVFGVEGMVVKPAGELIENTGHHHVIIDAKGIDAGVQVPKDETHIHFGAGQTEADIELAPGQHTLTMQFADGNHSSYGDVMATTITITVE